MLVIPSLIPRPILLFFFCSLVCVDNSTGEWRSSKNWEGLGALITWVTSGGCEMDVEGAGPHSRFCWSSISLSSSWLGLSALLLVETLVAVDNSAQPCLKLWLALLSLCPLDVAHVMNAPRPSPFSPLFHFCVLSLSLWCSRWVLSHLPLSAQLAHFWIS